jgi:hypothetical protein
MGCYRHPDREQVGTCFACGKFVCAECKAKLQDKTYCVVCADKIVMPQEMKSTGQTTLDSAGINGLGKGTAAMLPHDLSGWSWGAFGLSWIWGISNKVWISFLVFVLGIIWCIVLGIKGNEWAWRSNKWNSVDHFRKTQKTWGRWGIGIFVVYVLMAFLPVVALNVGSFIGKGHDESACIERQVVQTAVVAYMAANKGTVPTLLQAQTYLISAPNGVYSINRDGKVTQISFNGGAACSR